MSMGGMMAGKPETEKRMGLRPHAWCFNRQKR